MKDPIVNLGKSLTTHEKDELVNTDALCDLCRLKLSHLLEGTGRYDRRSENIFEFGDCLYKVEKIR